MGNVTVKKINNKKGITWAYRFDLLCVDGKRKQTQKGSFKTKSAALEAGRKAYAEYYGISTDKKLRDDISFYDLAFNKWLPVQKSTSRWKESTEINYRKKLNNLIVPTLGNMPVQNISMEIIQSMLNDLYNRKHGYCHKTVSDTHSLLSNIFLFAEANRYIYSSPMKFVKIPKIKETEREANYEKKQVRDIIPDDVLKAILERFEGTSSYLPLLLALKTGMRKGEVFGLAWCDIDFEKNCININRQLDTESSKLKGSNPKYNSKRTVPMSDDLKDILIRYKEKQDFNKEQLGLYYKETSILMKDDSEHFEFDVNYEGRGERIEFVNVYDDGKLVHPRVIHHASRIIHGYQGKKRLKKDSQQKYIYEDFNFHSLRHTFASKLRESGVSEKVITQLLGHSSPSNGIVARVTYNYLHATEKDLENARREIANF